MQIFHFHPVTGEFLGIGIADQSPLEPGVFLIPAFATELQQPEASSNQIPVFNGTGWELLSDYRGSEYWLPDGSHHVIRDIGVAPPEDALFEEPEQQPAVPFFVTPRQGELALIELDLLDPVKAYFDGLTGKDGAKARADFYRATEWRRDWPLLINAAKNIFGLTDEQIDQMFIYGASL